MRLNEMLEIMHITFTIGPANIFKNQTSNNSFVHFIIFSLQNCVLKKINFNSFAPSIWQNQFFMRH